MPLFTFKMIIHRKSLKLIHVCVSCCVVHSIRHLEMSAWGWKAKPHTSGAILAALFYRKLKLSLDFSAGTLISKRIAKGDLKADKSTDKGAKLATLLVNSPWWHFGNCLWQFILKEQWAMYKLQHSAVLRWCNFICQSVSHRYSHF